MKYIDTHAHYNDEQFASDLDQVLDKVKKANVEKVVVIGYNEETSKQAILLAKKYDYIYATIGFHPQNLEEYDENILEKLYLENMECNKIVAIGEIGLDYATVEGKREEQQNVFISQINFAKKYNLPIVVHTREASLDMYNILQKYASGMKVLLHCFAPTDDLVRLVLKEENYMVAFGGNITYKRNESFAKYIEMLPSEKIVIETDCPYLSPVPYRGKRNDSSNLNLINKRLSEYKNITEEEMAKITYDNSIKFYNI